MKKKKQELLQVERRKAFYEGIDAGTLSMGETLKQMRKLIGKNQAEFAEMVKVTLAAIRAIEQGKANPTVKTLNKVGAPFGLEIRFGRKNPAQRLKID